MAAAQTASQLEDIEDVDIEPSMTATPANSKAQAQAQDADTDTDANTDLSRAVTDTTPTPHRSNVHVHEHRLCHNPSKLPGLRFVDRGLLQGQNNPPAGLPSLPRSVSPPCSCSARVDSHQDSTTTTGPGPGPDPGTGTDLSTGRTKNSSQGCPQPRLGPASALDPVLQPVALRAGRLPPPPPPPAALAAPSLLHPVTEADETQSPSADGTFTDPAPAIVHRGSRASADKRSLQSIAIASPSEHSPPSQPSSYQAISPAAPISTPIAAKAGRSTSLRINAATTTATSANSSSPLAPRSEVGTDSSRFYTPANRPRARRNSSWDYTSPTARPPTRRNFSWDSTNASSPLYSRANKSTTTDEWAPRQREIILSKLVDLSHFNENTKTFPRRTSSASRPPTSYKPLPSGYATSGRIPPIRSFRSSGSRKSYPPDMNNSSLRYYDDGDEGQGQDQNPRDRSLRALEGRYTNDRSRDNTHPDLDDDVADSENNTADIFLNIAREDSSTFTPRRQTDRGSDDEQSTVVSPICPFIRL